MAPTSAQHRRTHNSLLINNLLSVSGTISPFTLVLDSLEQSGKPLLTELIANANSAKASVIFISFETLQRVKGTEHFIQAWETTEWHKQTNALVEDDRKMTRRTLIVIDALNAVCSERPDDIPSLLSSLIRPGVSLVAVYHTDIMSDTSSSQYSPAPLDMLSYLATTVFTIHSLHHVLARKAARDRSIVEPSFGLDEHETGIIQGLGANHETTVVLEMEHRRKSGRGVKEWYTLDTRPSTKPSSKLGLLDDYPGYHPKLDASEAEDEAQVRSTFEMGLTDRQRRDREAVVLPYFDAQRGNDEGGRILYDMGAEDDFDEEEDEI